MQIRGHAGWVLLLIIGGVYFGLSSNTGSVPGVGPMPCGSAWMSTDSVGTCAAAVSGSMTGSVLLLIVAALAGIGLGVRVVRG